MGEETTTTTTDIDSTIYYIDQSDLIEQFYDKYVENDAELRAEVSSLNDNIVYTNELLEGVNVFCLFILVVLLFWGLYKFFLSNILSWFNGV